MKDKVPWLLEQAASAFFVLLGAAIGFLSAWLKEWLDAKAAKQSFLIAVRHELQALDKQLERSIGELTEAQLRMERAARHRNLPHHFKLLFTRPISED